MPTFACSERRLGTTFEAESRHDIRSMMAVLELKRSRCRQAVVARRATSGWALAALLLAGFMGMVEGRCAEVAPPADARLLLASRLANYAGCEDAAWMHLPAIGIRHVFMSVPAADQVEATRRRLAEHDLDAVVFRGDADLSQPEGLDRLESQLAVCERLAVRHLFLSVKRREVEKAVMYGRLRQGGELAARHGVTIVIETHPDLGTNGDVLRETMIGVNHPHVRVNFDTGNIHFYNRGADAPTELRKVIEYVATVELKDHIGEFESWHFPALGRGRVDIPGVLRILREHRFCGPVTIEIEGVRGVPRSHADIERDVADSVSYLRSLAAFE